MAKDINGQNKQTTTDDWNLPKVKDVLDSNLVKLNYRELKGTLPIRQTEYMIRVPKKWNGTLLNDLDFCNKANSYLSMLLLEKGYALSGTHRRKDRSKSYDPAHEAHDFVTIFDLFEVAFGKPKRIIQLGCSGGGTVTLSMVEKYSDRIDGGIAACAATSQWMANMHLDGLFVMQSLIAPELPIVNLFNYENEQLEELGIKWKKAIDKAQKTPEGRARIALAITIGQWPAWGGRGNAIVDKPDITDLHALQESMYYSMAMLLPNLKTKGTSMIERAGGGQLRSNEGIDYVELFNNGNKNYKTAVKLLYKEAGINLLTDFEKINAAPRIKSDPIAIKYWSAPGRTHVGEPKVPLLRIHTSGDGLVYPVLTQGYEELVKQKGYSKLFRSAYVNNWGHCMFSSGEWLSAIETLMLRLDTGFWPETDPQAMNERAKKMEPNSKARFFNFQGVEKHNRTWVPSIENYIGEQK
ncbi:alpha/beta hydrolase [Postechiella marina]|uniref:Alpha/beta hydrolase n=1 Tax=Postechiella marina TaxID=943941 RepID=A0ABP8CE98_9FLAO